MIKVFPNPVNDFLNIHLNQNIQGEFTLLLFPGDGKLIEEKRFSGSNSIAGCSERQNY